MKRYQIHVAKKITAEIVVEAESEHLARQGVKYIDGKQLQWRESGPANIEHIDEIEIDTGAGKS